ncbi:hypothetical protein DFH09DRAFT_1315001 [Mycena vulgaris]|nr:hypothetical protein DFH09DRAFT_1315001 [Mycena vulgaris]
MRYQTYAYALPSATNACSPSPCAGSFLVCLEDEGMAPCQSPTSGPQPPLLPLLLPTVPAVSPPARSPPHHDPPRARATPFSSSPPATFSFSLPPLHPARCLVAPPRPSSPPRCPAAQVICTPPTLRKTVALTYNPTRGSLVMICIVLVLSRRSAIGVLHPYCHVILDLDALPEPELGTVRLCDILNASPHLLRYVRHLSILVNCEILGLLAYMRFPPQLRARGSRGPRVLTSYKCAYFGRTIFYGLNAQRV